MPDAMKERASSLPVAVSGFHARGVYAISDDGRPLCGSVLTRAAASGAYPNLATALATVEPVRSEDDVFESCIQRLIDVARPGTSPAARRTGNTAHSE
jgi:hypothetical protein